VDQAALIPTVHSTAKLLAIGGLQLGGLFTKNLSALAIEQIGQR
jgi:hypothetical protein